MADKPRDIPILFSAPMVKAIQGGTKTQTRRVCKPLNQWIDQDCREVRFHEGHWCHFLKGATMPLEKIPLRWAAGDRLWVRETIWQVSRYPGTLPSGEPEPNSACWGGKFHYAADGNPPNTPNRHYPDGLRNGSFAAPDPWASWIKRPAIHMPRRASRITLEVTNVRVERLQDITEADAIAEGAPCGGFADDGKFYEGAGTYRAGYAGLWDHINGPDAWDANPWVVAVTFRREIANG